MITLTPIITEKSIADAQNGKFTFKMDKTMGKNAIKYVIGNTFKVDVIGVATSIVKGRSRRSGARRIEKTKSAWKKAIVRLKAGQKIAAFEIGEQK
ncbi:MAG: 50S ribosomal protein L23 [Candidatus Levybacteria bacterium]|nr:50S ribosomal protein L23 [Candidatus Levybacteria bacterium]